MLQMRLKRFKQPWIWHIWTNTNPAFKLAQPVENPAQGALYVWWTWVRTQVISLGKAIWCHLAERRAKKLRLLEVFSVGAKLAGMEATVTIWKVLFTINIFIKYEKVGKLFLSYLMNFICLAYFGPKKKILRPKLTLFSLIWELVFKVRTLQCAETPISYLFCLWKHKKNHPQK